MFKKLLSPQSGLANLAIILLVAVLALSVGYFIFKSSKTQEVSQNQKPPKKIGIVQFLKILDPTVAGFKETMSKQGYQEGKDVIYITKVADGSLDKLKEYSKEFVDQNVDMIFTESLEGALAATQVTKEKNRLDIPIVYANATGPVKTGLAKDFRSSGNNSTGIAIDMAYLTAKKLEFLKQINPKMKKLAIVWSKVSDPTTDFTLEEIRNQASKQGIVLVEYVLKSPPGPDSFKETQQLVDTMKPGDFDAYFHMTGPVVNYPDNQKILMSIGEKLKVPSVYLQSFGNEDSWLLSYGHDLYGTGSQAAVVADKIFKGAKPSEIPLEYQRKNFLIVNLKAAKKLNINLPNSILVIADKKIE